MADEKWLDDLKEDIIIIKETLKNMVATNELKLIGLQSNLEAVGSNPSRCTNKTNKHAE